MTEYETSYPVDTFSSKPELPKNKMCRFAKRKDHSKIKSLSSQPRYMCRECGRVAGDRENLCKPEKI